MFLHFHIRYTEVKSADQGCENMRNVISESLTFTLPLMGALIALYWPNTLLTIKAVGISGLVSFLLYGLYIYFVDKFLEI